MAGKNYLGETPKQAKKRQESEGTRVPMGKKAGAGVLASAGSVAKQIKAKLASREGRALNPTRQQTPPQYGQGSHSNDEENYD